MTSIGKITPSAISIPNELTVAAAAFNIDFSLLKIEAPAAFHGVRDALSVHRRGEAEGGLPHMTARRLGALFDAKVPRITNLIEAYGNRVSEICSGLENKSEHQQNAGIFSDQRGPDGTSIWAGATSGSGALAVHLLSCLLARIWKSHEAISLWVELVERRKQEIISNMAAGSPTELAAAMAAQQIITRDHLSSWDASARSWLHTADSAKRLQQTQLTLIINNVGIAVNSSTEPYESVMQAWISALEAMERLVQGTPQRVHDGAILLAISSWHLYPNMEVLVDEAKQVDQNDELMHGALITICQSQTSTASREGVYWSLPLSRMRFYNPPEIRKRHVASDTSRVTINEFWIVMLGAIIGPWVVHDIAVDEICEWIILIKSRVECMGSPEYWMTLISNAASTYLTATGLEQQQMTKLLGLGRRRCKHFLSSYGEALPFLFDLANFSILLKMVKDSPIAPGAGSTHQIAVLRSIALGLECSTQDLIIRYLTEQNEGSSGRAYAYASAIPVAKSTSKRTHNSEIKLSHIHTRWIVAFIKRAEVACEAERCPCMPTSASDLNCYCRASGQKCTEFCHAKKSTCDNFATAFSVDCVGTVPPRGSSNPRRARVRPLEFDFESDFNSESFSVSRPFCFKRPYCRGCYNRLAKEHTKQIEEVCEFILPDDVLDDNEAQFTLSTPSFTDPVTFEYLIGERESVALFKRTGAEIRRRCHSQSPGSASQAQNRGEILGPYCKATQQEFSDIVASPHFQKSKFLKHLEGFFFNSYTTQQSILALELATTLYKSMEGATISLEILKLTLSEASWTQQLKSSHHEDKDGAPYDLVASNHTSRPTQLYSQSNSRSVAMRDIFACLAMFDSGQFDIEPSSLEGVFALSSGDSIYVSSAFLDDPAADPTSRPYIRRVFGNLGRSGMTFLTCPVAPKLDAYSPKSWHLVNHFPFNEEFQNSFTGTSLHLSFTDYELPIDLGIRGLRDNQAVIAESIITLYDRGKQLGDLDIVPMISGKTYHLWSQCEHQNDSCGSLLPKQLVTIDCWDELFDFPEKKAIFRATGNWQARIAGLTASLQLGKKVLVLPQRPCLTCLSSIMFRPFRNEFDVIIA